jgi:hypothetical protein
VSRDKPMRRFAQDDDFVGGLKKNTSDRLTLVGRSPGWRFERRKVPQGRLKIRRDPTLDNLQPSPFDKLRAGSAGLDLFHGGPTFSRALEFLHFRDDVPEETRGFRESPP